MSEQNSNAARKPEPGLPPFSRGQTYPYDPAKGKTETSRDAAKHMNLTGESGVSRAATLREKSFNIILASGGTGRTADEVAKALGESVLAIRPRITELKKSRRIKVKRDQPAGPYRRENLSGCAANVMVAASINPNQCEGCGVAYWPGGAGGEAVNQCPVCGRIMERGNP